MDILQGSDATEARWNVDNSGENHEGIGEIERGASNSEEDPEWLIVSILLQCHRCRNTKMSHEATPHAHASANALKLANQVLANPFCLATRTRFGRKEVFISADIFETNDLIFDLIAAIMTHTRRFAINRSIKKLIQQLRRQDMLLCGVSLCSAEFWLEDSNGLGISKLAQLGRVKFETFVIWRDLEKEEMNILRTSKRFAIGLMIKSRVRVC